MGQWIMSVKMIDDLIATVYHKQLKTGAKFGDGVLKKTAVIVIVVGQENRYVVRVQIAG